MNKRSLFLLLSFSLLSSVSFSQVSLPRLISDGLILQRDTEIEIWGWAAANEEVGLTLGKQSFSTRANIDGEWTILLPSREAGGPYDMVFKASNKVIVKDVMFGDVWICSGQSNMELSMERVKEKYPDQIKSAENPYIRQFLVPDTYDFKVEHSDFDAGSWQSATPESVLGFSAVAYFFAKELHARYQVPVGIINAAMGGSPVEAWMSESALKEFPAAYNEMQKFKNDSLIQEIQKSDRSRSETWYRELNMKDKGLANTPAWSDPTFDDAGWGLMTIPAYWSDTFPEMQNGALWFRKEIDVPASMVGKPAKLWLGRIVDQDYVYINGELVGSTSYQYPPRRYVVNSSVLKQGKNNLTVRVINNSGKGGFVSDKPYCLTDGTDTIDLKGSWRFKQGTSMKPLKGQTFIRWKPGGLYNSMIAPLKRCKIKGAIWYQGESNANNPLAYEKLFPALIYDWRQNLDQEDFPFLFVQLPNFMEASEEPQNSKWAELRQTQLQTLSVQNTGMVVAIDLGEWNDIHPLNKYDVGKRLAQQARKLAYHEMDLLAEHPLPLKADFKRKKIIITFKNTGSGLVAKKDEELHCFSVSANQSDFLWAKAKIKGNKVIVRSDRIKDLSIVRYAWADNPETANLFTKEGLPASPFQLKKYDRKN